MRKLSRSLEIHKRIFMLQFNKHHSYASTFLQSPMSVLPDHIKLKISDLSSGSLGRTLTPSVSISSRMAIPRSLVILGASSHFSKERGTLQRLTGHPAVSAASVNLALDNMSATNSPGLEHRGVQETDKLMFRYLAMSLMASITL